MSQEKNEMKTEYIKRRRGMRWEKQTDSLILYFAVFGFITYYHFCGSHFMCTEGDYCNPTGSISFILPRLVGQNV